MVINTNKREHKKNVNGMRKDLVWSQKEDSKQSWLEKYQMSKPFLMLPFPFLILPNKNQREVKMAKEKKKKLYFSFLSTQRTIHVSPNHTTYIERFILESKYFFCDWEISYLEIEEWRDNCTKPQEQRHVQQISWRQYEPESI